jgi:hypothetical protein
LLAAVNILVSAGTWIVKLSGKKRTLNWSTLSLPILLLLWVKGSRA